MLCHKQNDDQHGWKDIPGASPDPRRCDQEVIDCMESDTGAKGSYRSGQCQPEVVKLAGNTVSDEDAA